MAPGWPRPRPGRRLRLGNVAGALLLGAGTLGLGACALPPGASAPVAPAELATRLPVEAAGFRRGATLPLPQRMAGWEVAYASRGRTAAGATVELFRLAAGPVPDGADSPAAAEAFAALLEDALRSAGYRQQQERGRLLLPAAGSRPGPAAPVGLRCAETTGLYGREPVQGLLCAGGVGGSVVRLRVTMPQREPLPADPQAFAVAILAALRGG